MMRELTKVVPAQPADATVASFLAETDNVTRTLKGYSDTLDGRLEAAHHCSIQTAQVCTAASLGDCESAELVGLMFTNLILNVVQIYVPGTFGVIQVLCLQISQHSDACGNTPSFSPVHTDASSINACLHKQLDPLSTCNSPKRTGSVFKEQPALYSSGWRHPGSIPYCTMPAAVSAS